MDYHAQNPFFPTLTCGFFVFSSVSAPSSCPPPSSLPHHSLTHSSHTHSLITLTHHTHSSHSVTHSLARSLTHSPTDSLTHPLTHSHSLTHTHTHSLTHSPTHPLTHSLTCACTYIHTHTNSPTITPPSLLYFLFPSCFSMLSLSLKKLVTCGVIRSYNFSQPRRPELISPRMRSRPPKSPGRFFRSPVSGPSRRGKCGKIRWKMVLKYILMALIVIIDIVNYQTMSKLSLVQLWHELLR